VAVPLAWHAVSQSIPARKELLMASIFTRIVEGEIPCHKLAEDDRFLAFLDVRPIRAGHALVIPKQEIDYLFDMDDALLGDLMRFAKPVARAIERVVPCKRIGVVVIGLEVPHAHVHLVPIDRIADIDFALARPAEAADLASLADKIKAASPDLPA
jgi:histidine triad (HIT) family protein